MRDTFSILMVCTGNICRSPLAAQLLADSFWDVPEIKVESAGTHAVPGQSMPEDSLAVALMMGATSADIHQARQVTEDMLKAADLILTMTREQRRFVVEMSPRVTRRVFAIQEFARLAAVTADEDLVGEIGQFADSPVKRLEAAVRTATYGRSLIPPVHDPDEEDVPDPYLNDRAAYVLSARQLIPAVEAIALMLRRSLEVPA